MVEVSCDNPTKFLLSVLASFNRRLSLVDRTIVVQPLLAEHRQEDEEERSGEIREHDCLNVDDR
jgi:hypothetical protein